MTVKRIGRREFLMRTTISAVLAGAGFVLSGLALAQETKIKVGLMLPYTGTFAPLGVAIENGFRLALQEAGGKFGNREIEFFKVDDESEPSKATDNVNRLVNRDKVDVVVGTVHSGVAAAMIRVTRESGTLHLIPNAGVGVATGQLCAPNIIRTSFSNWQPGYGMGVALSHRKNVRHADCTTSSGPTRRRKPAGKCLAASRSSDAP